VRFARRIGTDEDEGHAGKDGDQAVEQEDPSPAGKRCYGDEADAIAEQPAEDTAQSVGAVPDSEAERLFVSLDAAGTSSASHIEHATLSGRPQAYSIEPGRDEREGGCHDGLCSSQE
jgi:hypothetical protein